MRSQGWSPHDGVSALRRRRHQPPPVPLSLRGLSETGALTPRPGPRAWLLLVRSVSRQPVARYCSRRAGGKDWTKVPARPGP